MYACRCDTQDDAFCTRTCPRRASSSSCAAAVATSSALRCCTWLRSFSASSAMDNITPFCHLHLQFRFHGTKDSSNQCCRDLHAHLHRLAVLAMSGVMPSSLCLQEYAVLMLHSKKVHGWCHAGHHPSAATTLPVHAVEEFSAQALLQPALFLGSTPRQMPSLLQG